MKIFFDCEEIGVKEWLEQSDALEKMALVLDFDLKILTSFYKLLFDPNISVVNMANDEYLQEVFNRNEAAYEKYHRLFMRGPQHNCHLIGEYFLPEGVEIMNYLSMMRDRKRIFIWAKNYICIFYVKDQWDEIKDVVNKELWTEKLRFLYSQ